MKKILKTRKPKMMLSLFLVIAIMFNIASISVFATYDDDMNGTNYYSGGFTSVNGIKYTYTTGTATTNRIYAQEAAARWSNNVSSNVYLQLNTTVTNNGYLAPIVVSVLEYTPVNTTYIGRMFPYKVYGPTQVIAATNSETWVKALCYVYNNSHFSGQFKVARLRHTATHEMGHSLSIGHPADGSSAVMDSSCLQVYNLQSYDINKLQLKWGT